jgi:fructokinase
MKVVSIGEVVWDMFGDKRVLGGAPVNVAYHLRCLGHDVHVITRVGDDDLGRDALERLVELGLPLAGVQHDSHLATGRVLVTLNERREPKFDIIFPAAWDNISLAEAEKATGEFPFALVFGTLAQRDQRSRETICALRSRAAVCFYDVNLRPPFTSEELVLESLYAANVVKVNGDELKLVVRFAGIAEEEAESNARGLCGRFGIDVLVVTEGVHGAWIYADGTINRDSGSSVMVVDTVGAGDAFFAAIIDGYLQKKPWVEVVRAANRRGGYVASQQGATPPMPSELP